jgi:hypothetical protein
MTMTDPITPPPELVNLWMSEDAPWDSDSFGVLTARPSQLRHIATQAAQWGANQELEACCRWLPKLPPWSANDLRKHRRPKPPSLKEQALAALEVIPKLVGFESERDAIRAALEALDD